LDDGEGTNLKDYTINGNNGTICRAISKNIQSEIPQNTRMNILFAFYIPSGGVETLNRQRFFALNKKGVNCHFLYTQPGTGLQNKVDTSIFISNNDFEIKDIIIKGKYDAIVVGSDFKLLERIRNLGYQGILIFEIQGLGLNKEHANVVLKRNSFIINKYCNALLYPQTPHLIQVIESNFPTKKKFSFHNCFNMDEFKYRNHPKYDKPIIGWVGRLEENKNWRDFLLIGAELIKENPFIQLWMFEDNTLGVKSERIAFEQEVDELNLKNNLKIYANQPHSSMADHFSIIGDSGGFLCSTSKVEGFGYAVLEAMICRCPVLSTDSDGVKSLIKHNETGKFFEIGNISQAVQEAKEIMLSYELREKIKIKGLKHIETHFSLEKYANNFLKMINTLRS
jgi:glycosyltransferase involved in cell wall biosynthesis